MDKLLKGVQLKKAETTEKGLNPQETLFQFRRNQEKANATNVDKWYDGLKDELIPSKLIPLTKDQAKALLHYYQFQKMNQGNPLCKEENDQISSLASSIDAAVSEGNFLEKSGGFFVRLSTRSPKDCTILSEKTKNAVSLKRSELEKEGKTIDDNTLLGIIYRSSIQSLIVKSGEEAVTLLGSSRRIWQDIEVSLDSEKFDLQVVIREWVVIPNEYEFRGFVYNRKLTAISSYNRVVFWPQLPALKSEIETRLISYWKSIESKISPHLTNFIIDFAFTEDLKRVFIVELNPFYDFEGNSTNAELFDWEKDDDILTGKAPFQFRILESAPDRNWLDVNLPKAFKIRLGHLPAESWREGIDHL